MIVGIIRRKPVLTYASIIFGDMLASVNSVMRCKNYAQARILAVCRQLMSLLSVHALPVVNALTRSLKSTARSRAVRIFHCRCIFIRLIDSNCCSLFGFFQITSLAIRIGHLNYSNFQIKPLHPTDYSG